MSSRRITIAIVLSVAFLVSISSDLPSNPPKPVPKINVSDFRVENVIGRLGHPLGTVLRITGEAMDGNETRWKRDMGATLLKVLTVNGQVLSEPQIFRFHRAYEEINKPAFKSQFDYYVHEWGAFDGAVYLPAELKTYTLIPASDGFYYHSEITIHKSNTVEPMTEKPL